MITLYGVTEDGTTVPVQVTDDGKLVVHKEGGYTPGMDLEAGNITTTGAINSADDVTVGTFNFDSPDAAGALLANGGTVHSQRKGNYSGNSDLFCGYKGTDPVFKVSPVGDITTNGVITTSGAIQHSSLKTTSDEGSGFKANPSGTLLLQRSSSITGTSRFITCFWGQNVVLNLNANGNFAINGGVAGITGSGELYFTSRGERYKIVVQNGMCMADTYTREQQIRDGVAQDVDTTDIVIPD